MAGLFYLGRMFVYHREALEKSEPYKTILVNQIALMETRVYRFILQPALVLTWIFGLLMVFSYGWDWFKLNLWIHFKLLFLLFLSAYQAKCKTIIGDLAQETMEWTSFQFRLFNEVPTVLMVIILSLAVFKNTTNPWVLLLCIFMLIATLIGLTKLYKKVRKG